MKMIYDIKEQLEFIFCKSYYDIEIKKLKNRIESWNNFCSMVHKLCPNVTFPTVTEIFKEYKCDKIDSDLCFPITILLGDENQFEFNFVKDIDRVYWGYDIEYKYERKSECSTAWECACFGSKKS